MEIWCQGLRKCKKLGTPEVEPYSCSADCGPEPEKEFIAEFIREARFE